MSAENSIDGMPGGITNNFLFESSDETDGVLDSFLGVGAEGPVTETESTTEEINKRIQGEEELVANVPEEGQPLHVLHDCVELVTVHDQDSTPVGRFMNHLLFDGDVAVGAVKFGHHFIVISRDVDDPGAFARFAQDFLNDVVVLLRPVDTAPQLPDVDQVADDIKSLAIIIAQEIKERARVRAARPEMNIGNPRAAHSSRRVVPAVVRLERKSRKV